MVSTSICIQILILMAFFSSVLSLTRQAGSDLQCQQCDHIERPSGCLTSTVCGHGEICYTQEFTDHNNQLAYHMGCQSSKYCNYLILVGRRDLHVDDVQYCFDCCNTDGCNKGLCSGIKSTTPPPACPNGFVKWIDSCYMFSLEPLYWDAARHSCQAHGADLVSVNSQNENTFIVNHLNDMNPPNAVRGIWLGAAYNEQQGKFKWVDGSDVVFNHFKFRGAWNGTDYRLDMMDPNADGSFAGWPWDSDIGYLYRRGHICEVKSAM